MRLFIVCLMLVFVPYLITAQQLTGTVKGKVVDKDSHQPLAGVNVFLINSNPQRGVTTDEDGSFKLEQVNVGRQSLKFSYLGYDDAVLSELLVTSAKDLYLNVEMQERITNLK
jgi:hypothetical protein